MLLDHTTRTQVLRWAITCLILLAMPRCLAEPPVREHTTECLDSKQIEDSSLVKIRSFGVASHSDHTRWFVITHGMYGTQRHDRFHQLAEKLVSVFPDSRVVLVDWSQASTPKTSWLGIPNPHPVANRINPVAAQAATKLNQLGIQTRKATLIGESFGNWVNAEIARHLGKVDRIVAMNPASELGGYSPPDLRPLSTTSWSFHSDSVFDTLMPIGNLNILLESIDGTSDLSKHTAGIRRLTGRLRAGDKSWLTATDQDGGPNRRRFTARATVEGQLLPCDLPMQRPTEQKREPYRRQPSSTTPLQSIAIARS